VKKTLATIIGISFIALGSACGPGKTPEGVCKKMESLAKDAGEKTEGDDGMKQCVETMKEMEKQDKEAFGKMADCVIGASDMKGATDCIMKIEPAGGGDDKPAEGEEKAEDKPE
jgi:hypothetical protein